MKLLLTSGGIANESIKKAFFDLVDKKPEEISLAFIPTASNIEKGDKGWLIKDLVSLKNLNLKSISIVDISAVGRDIWEPQLQDADVLFFEGGNTFHLMEWVNKSGLSDILLELLKTKVYVGVSAGSMILSPDLSLNVTQKLYKEDLERTENMAGLGLVDFYVLPHYTSDSFSLRNKENVTEAIKEIKNKIYALDDMSALKIIDDKIEIITEGDCLEIN
jgi:dipeptidase E